MKTLSSVQQTYLDVASKFHFATRDHFALWFTGLAGRHKQTERVLPALVKKGALRTVRYGKRLIYAIPERFRFREVASREAGEPVAIFPHHGLCCTDILIRFVLADRQCEVISEKFFRHSRWGCVPEWGIRYPTGSALLLEFSTESNVYAPGNLASKIARYRDKLGSVALGLAAEPVVLFVLDIPRSEVGFWMQRLSVTDASFFFVDYQTFMNTPAAKQLKAPIYLWGADAQRYPLRQHD